MLKTGHINIYRRDVSGFRTYFVVPPITFDLKSFVEVFSLAKITVGILADIIDNSKVPAITFLNFLTIKYPPLKIFIKNTSI